MHTRIVPQTLSVRRLEASHFFPVLTAPSCLNSTRIPTKPHPHAVERRLICQR